MTAGRDLGIGLPNAAFERAETIAGRNGLPRFGAWRCGLERRYTVMPPWYWDDRACRQHYVAHIRTAIDWQRRERRINRGNADFHRSLAAPGAAVSATGAARAESADSQPPTPPERH